MDERDRLERFLPAHRRDYPDALREIRGGRKRSHWMWYIFPQLRGLGYSSTADYYGIRDGAEARAFLADPYLGASLREISQALLELPGDDAYAVFGYPDHLKLCSCMTLFAAVSEPGSVFRRVLEKYFQGQPDRRTLELLGQETVSR